MPICKVCGKEYKRKDSRSRKTCGDPACRRRWKNMQGALTRGREPFIPHMEECPYCQEMFLQTQSNQIVCPKHSCKAAHKRRMARLRYVPAVKDKPKAPQQPLMETRFCEHCGKDFRVHFQSTRLFCTAACEEADKRLKMAQAYLATAEDLFEGLDFLPPGQTSWYSAQMMPVI